MGEPHLQTVHPVSARQEISDHHFKLLKASSCRPTPDLEMLRWLSLALRCSIAPFVRFAWKSKDEVT